MTSHEQNPHQVVLDVYNLRLAIDGDAPKRVVSDEEFRKIIGFFEKHRYLKHSLMVESEFIRKFFPDNRNQYHEFKRVELGILKDTTRLAYDWINPENLQKGRVSVKHTELLHIKWGVNETLMGIKNPEDPEESAYDYWGGVLWRETSEFQDFLDCFTHVREIVSLCLKEKGVRKEGLQWLSAIKELVSRRTVPSVLPFKRGSGELVDVESMPAGNIDLRECQLKVVLFPLPDAFEDFHLVFLFNDISQGLLQLADDSSWVKQCVVCGELFATPPGKHGAPRVYCTDPCSAAYDKQERRFYSQARRRFTSDCSPARPEILEKRRNWKREQTRRYFLEQLHQRNIDCFESALPNKE